MTIARQWVEEFFGDVAPLVAQIGSSEGLAALSGTAASRSFQEVSDFPSLRRFLWDYRSRLLVPIELPVIRQAHAHAGRYEAMELIRLDQRLAAESGLREFAVASRRVGKRQLKRLRPLRDHRVVQRYLHAVEAGEAHAWHTIVYGLILSLYSLPLRQGLLSYAQQTTRSFVFAAAPRLRLTDQVCRELVNELGSDLLPAVNAVLAAGYPPRPIADQTRPDCPGAL